MKRRAIREGDRVRVVRPVFVLRCGYPKRPRDFLTPEVHDAAREALRKVGVWAPDALRLCHESDRIVERVARELAYAACLKAGFGGCERTLHTVERPEMAGREFAVTRRRVAMTGVRCPPSGRYEDYEPGGLEDRRAHVILDLSSFTVAVPDVPEGCWSLAIEACDVELVEEVPR